LKIEALAIPDIKLMTPSLFRDERGFFSETFNARTLAALGIGEPFVQDNHSLSVPRGVVRGLHFQAPPHAQDKLVRVVRGAILDVAVDIRHGSPTFGKHVAAVLSAANWSQMWVPRGFAHGFCTLEPDTEVLYKVTDYYAPECDRGLRWDDPALAIAWPVEPGEALLSPKDTKHPPLAELPVHFRYQAMTIAGG
jgi:dTDP-4-dehydrorhamnose 3,5-epimerase